MPGADGMSLTRWIVEQNFYGAGIIVMLTFPHLKLKPEFEALGAKTCVVKPLGAPELKSAILRTLGVDNADIDPPLPVNAPSRSGRVPHRPLKILVAEDTPFNQKFILRLLERWNHQATLAENGRQALEFLQHETFDIVLMDVQMPDMDGLTATKEFRRWEKELKAHSSKLKGYAPDVFTTSGIQHRVPIIAMTAHAVKGDRESCLDAGMDVYISKPIDSEKLFEAIETLTHKAGNSKNAAAEFAAVDTRLLLEAFDGDWRFLQEIVEVFLSDYPRLMDDLRRANAEGDWDLLLRSAHSLKGMLKNFQAAAAAEVAFEIEAKARAENFDAVPTKIEQLTDRMTEVDKILRSMVAQQSENQ